MLAETVSTSGPRIRSVFDLDLRSLAAMRIGLGFLIVVDLINRARAFTAHYTNEGVLPAGALTAEFERDWQLSLHLVSSHWVLAMLFVLAGVLGLMVMVGFRTRAATVASWLLMVSLHTRNPWVIQGGDDLFRLLLFWGMFLPLGARWSIDAIRRPEPDRPPLIFNMATVALVTQVVFVYAFATVSKFSHSVWWPDGLGIYYSLSVEQFTTRLGLFMLEFPGLLRFLSYATLLLQALVPVLLLSPLWRDRIRAALPPVMIGLHVGFAMTMQLGLFSWITCTMWLALLPPSTWSWLGARLPKWKLTAKLVKRHESLAEALRGRIENKRQEAGGPRRSWIDTTPLRWALALLIVYSLWWNLWRADRMIYRMPASVESVGRLLKLDQRWHMFSSPPRWSQWYAIAGIKADGTAIDVFGDGGPVSLDKPELVSETFQNQRWRKYLTNLARESGKPHRKHFAAYLCRSWNSEHQGDDRIAGVRIHRMRQATPGDPTSKRPPPDQVLLGMFRCED